MRYPIAVSFLLIFFLGCHSAPAPPAADAATGTVTVQIEQEGTESITLVVPSVADGSTLEDVMRSLKGASVSLSGSGQTAFIHSINGVATDASQGWTFKVDGNFANEGIGTTVLHPPTEVTWTFGDFQM